MNAITKALSNSRAMVASIEQGLKAFAGPDFTQGAALSFSPFQGGARHSRQYNLYEGWVYSAIHVLSSEGASQPVNLGRMSGGEGDKARGFDGVRLKAMNAKRKLPSHVTKRVGDAEFETIFSHPLLDVIESPNVIQDRWQFVYNFIANINLTGISYIVGGETSEGWQLYSLPTSWVRVDHSKGPFSQFHIVNPRDPQARMTSEPLTRDNVAFAMLPNPGDPLGYLSPISSQARAVEIDQYIQTSQTQFFENGIWPSVVIETGHDPHPDVTPGLRPRLTAEQRAAVHTAIHKTMAGVYNAGNPVIIDGLIEGIHKFSQSEPEMGWERSEKAMRTRILSAFGVHPFIIGEEMPGSYAQAYVVQDRFCKRVNVFLDMLGNVLSNFVGGRTGERLFFWWTEVEAKDPTLHAQNLREAAKMNVITSDEYRAELGFPPLPEEEKDAKRGKLLDNPAAMTNSIAIAKAVKDKTMPREGAVILMARFLEIPEDEAEKMLPEEPEEEPPPPVPFGLQPQLPPPEQGEQQDASDEEDEQDSEDLNDDALDEAVRAAKRLLAMTPRATAALIDAASTQT